MFQFVSQFVFAAVPVSVQCRQDLHDERVKEKPLADRHTHTHTHVLIQYSVVSFLVTVRLKRLNGTQDEYEA